jgi:hypothetical protein
MKPDEPNQHRFILHKVSLPNVWTKTFPNERALIVELKDYICGTCMRGDEWPEDEPHPPDPWSLRDLLSTSCGCEFDVEIKD